jgi:hypothetical protein
VIQKLAFNAVRRCGARASIEQVLGASSENQIHCEPPRLVYFLAGSRRPRSLDQRGFGNGTDVQIGGGVRVGDAFQAIVGSKPIAVWVTEFCV